MDSSGTGFQPVQSARMSCWMSDLLKVLRRSHGLKTRATDLDDRHILQRLRMNRFDNARRKLDSGETVFRGHLRTGARLHRVDEGFQLRTQRFGVVDEKLLD